MSGASFLSQLDPLNLSDNTIVLFLSDNGPHSYRWNGGMNGRKSLVDERGLRSPLFIRWPNVIQPGATISQVTEAIDLLPSLAALAEIPLETNKPIDGVNSQPLLFNESTAWPARILSKHWINKASLRTHPLRLTDSGSLFDIINDRGQRQNIADQFPDETARLQAALGNPRGSCQSSSNTTRIGPSLSATPKPR